MPLKGRAKVDKAIQQIKINANNDIRGVYFTGLRAMIKQTPVDEGRARNNWFLTERVPFSLSGRSGSKGGNASYTSVAGMPLKVLGKKLFFTNNLPYIETLEYGGYPSPNSGEKTRGGFSTQAPSGWVRRTLIAMRNKIRVL